MANNSLSNRESNPYIDNLMRKAREDYGFISQHNPAVVLENGPGFAETYSADETGTPDYPRPAGIPLGRFGVGVRQPNKFTHHDLAMEMLHVDPYANEVRGHLAASLEPQQIEAMKNHYLDDQGSLDEGLSQDHALRNGTDAIMRGALGQAPQEVNTAMGFSGPQTALIEGLRNYMKTGKR